MNGLILDRDMSLLPCLVGLVKEGLIMINMLFFLCAHFITLRVSRF